MPPPPDDLPLCTACGACCHLTVELTDGLDDVPVSMIAYHDGVPFMDQHGNGACVALDQTTRLCTIYERRPDVCRRFERGATLCRRILAAGRLRPT